MRWAIMDFMTIMKCTCNILPPYDTWFRAHCSIAEISLGMRVQIKCWLKVARNSLHEGENWQIVGNNLDCRHLRLPHTHVAHSFAGLKMLRLTVIHSRNRLLWAQERQNWHFRIWAVASDQTGPGETLTLPTAVYGCRVGKVNDEWRII